MRKHSGADVRLALEMVGLWEKRDAMAAVAVVWTTEVAGDCAGTCYAGCASVYLFDEPFAGLFPSMVQTIVGVIQDLRQQGKSVVLIEHNMDLIRQLSDTVFVMR